MWYPRPHSLFHCCGSCFSKLRRGATCRIRSQEECSFILQALGPPDSGEGEDHLRIDYTSKQLEDLLTKYQAIASRGQFVYGQSREVGHLR